MQRYDYLIRHRLWNSSDARRTPDKRHHAALVYALGRLDPNWQGLMEKPGGH